MAARRLTLVGYRASGKTTLAHDLARLTGWRAVDLDVALVERAGRDIPTIFAEDGEQRFRDLEAETLQAMLASADDLIIATGGGIVERADNRVLLQQSARPVLYLAAPAAVLSARLQANQGDRPSLTGATVADEVAAMLARREPWYREVADHELSTDQAWDQVVHAARAIVENL
ncbi:MAG: shikimate kinase [Planctomycetota bacterium]|jgi:shikimate kinase|nr:shikimate kinase [Planctomycetota bacterium]